MLTFSVDSGFFGFWGEDPRPNQRDSVSEELDSTLTTKVVGLASGQPRSDRFYWVGRATGWVGQH